MSACVSSRWTFGQKLGHRRCTEMVSLLYDCRKEIVRSHEWKGIESLSSSLIYFLDGHSLQCWPGTHLLMCCWRSKFFEKILSQKLHFSFGPFPFSCSAEEWNSVNEYLSYEHLHTFLSMVIVLPSAVSLINNLAYMFYDWSVLILSGDSCGTSSDNIRTFEVLLERVVSENFPSWRFCCLVWNIKESNVTSLWNSTKYHL